MYLEIHVDRRRKIPYAYGLLRERSSQGGKVRHRTRGRITSLSPEQRARAAGIPPEGLPALATDRLSGEAVAGVRRYGLCWRWPRTWVWGGCCTPGEKTGSATPWR